LKINIWIINHHATLNGRHVKLAKELTNKNHNVTIFSSSFKHNRFIETKEYKNGEYFLEESFNTHNRIWVKTPSYKNSYAKRFLAQVVFYHRVTKIADKRKKPDVIIGSSVHLFAGLAGKKIAKKNDIPFLFEVRDLWPQTLIDLDIISDKHPVTLLFKFLEKHLYKSADKIITVLPKGDDYISDLGIDRNKVIYIPNGVDLDWFDSKYDEELKDQNLKNYFDNKKDKFIFAYTGAHGISNGLDTVVEAAKILENKGMDDIRILLVGDGPEKDKLIKKVKKHNLNNIGFIDRVEKDEVPKILKNSNANISIRVESDVHQYGVSMNKIFDYLASKRPMISAIGAPKDFAEISGSGIKIPPNDPQKLAESFIDIYNMSEDKRKILGKNGREFVKNNHTYSVLAKKLIATIEDVISN